jgi:hypothetical protein
VVVFDTIFSSWVNFVPYLHGCFHYLELLLTCIFKFVIKHVEWLDYLRKAQNSLLRVSEPFTAWVQRDSTSTSNVRCRRTANVAGTVS